MHAQWCRVRPQHPCCPSFFYLHPGDAAAAGLEGHGYKEAPDLEVGSSDPTTTFLGRMSARDEL